LGERYDFVTGAMVSIHLNLDGVLFSKQKQKVKGVMPHHKITLTTLNFRRAKSLSCAISLGYFSKTLELKSKHAFLV
jgi:hypothetical protein